MQNDRLCVVVYLVLIACLPTYVCDDRLYSHYGTGAEYGYDYDYNPFADQIDYDILSSNRSLTVSDWALHYLKVCGSFCQNGTLVRTAKRCMDTICFPCDCDETCVSRATCCPSMNDFENNVTFDESNILGRNKVSDAFYRARCEPVEPEFGIAYLTVFSCPLLWEEPTTRLKCENATGDTLESAIHYLDVHTGLVYRNIHCAVCNGLDLESSSHSHESGRDTEESRKRGDSTRLRPLQYEASCLEYSSLMHITDGLEFYQTAVSSMGCTVDFKDISGVTTCPGPTFAGRLQNCSTNSSQSMRDACYNTPPAPALMMYDDRNAFCNVCHGRSLTNVDTCRIRSSVNMDEPPSVLLFGSKRKQEDRRSTGKLDICGSEQRGTKKEPCLASTCPGGKIAVDGGRCETAFEEVRGLAYDFQIVLKSAKGLRELLQNELLDSMNTTFVQRFPNVIYSLLFVVQSECVMRNDSTRGMQVFITGSVLAPMSMSRDVFENQTLHAILNVPWDVSLTDSIGNAHTVSLKTVCIGNETCGIYYSAVQPLLCFTAPGEFKNNASLLPQNVKKVWLLPTLLCPYVTLPWAGTPVIEDSKLIVTLDPDGSKEHNITMDWEPSGMSYEGGKVQMCVDMYKNSPALRGRHAVVEHTPNIISIVHYYLDTVCIFVSCVLLVVSIATYLMFPCLCSLPGLNTLCLCLCLFVAQLSLLITSLFGTRGYFSETYCLVHGIVLHYSWVASFVWMNTCCIHTYRVFTGIKIRYGLRNFVWYCVYSFGLPVVVIVVVILTTTMTTDGTSIGYDRHVCFLDTSTTILIVVMGLLVPLLFSVTSNGVLFILTIKTIVSMTRMKLQPKSSHGVITYVKLSTVTGVFCLFAATAIQFDNPVLSLIASPFAALQGVFIFASFIANKRVYKLYVGLISNRKQSSISSQNDVSVTTKT